MDAEHGSILGNTWGAPPGELPGGQRRRREHHLCWHQGEHHPCWHHPARQCRLMSTRVYSSSGAGATRYDDVTTNTAGSSSVIASYSDSNAACLICIAINSSLKRRIHVSMLVTMVLASKAPSAGKPVSSSQLLNIGRRLPQTTHQRLWQNPSTPARIRQPRRQTVRMAAADPASYECWSNIDAKVLTGPILQNVYAAE